MKLAHMILATGALLVALTQPAAADPFFRPLLSLDSPTNTGFSSTAGYGFVAGSRLGARKAHEVSFELHYNRWDYSATHAGYAVSGKETNLPLLLNYRYHFGAGTDRVRFYCGPALGLASTRFSVAATAPGSRLKVSDSDWAFTWSGSAGVIVALSAHTDLDLGYRYLQAQGRHFSVGNTAVRVDDRKTHVFYSGLNLRF